MCWCVCVYVCVLRGEVRFFFRWWNADSIEDINHSTAPVLSQIPNWTDINTADNKRISCSFDLRIPLISILKYGCRLWSLRGAVNIFFEQNSTCAKQNICPLTSRPVAPKLSYLTPPFAYSRLTHPQCLYHIKWVSNRVFWGAHHLLSEKKTGRSKCYNCTLHVYNDRCLFFEWFFSRWVRSPLYLPRALLGWRAPNLRTTHLYHLGS